MSEQTPDTLSSDEWVPVGKKRPPKYGEYRIKNEDMEGYGHFSGDGWTVSDEWYGPITHWARKQKCH